MPIKGLTERGEARLPLAGRIYKGAPKGERRPGKDLDHFRFEPETEEAGAAWAKHFLEPSSLTFFTPHETPDAAFSAFYEIWDASGLVHRCDGEWIRQLRADDSGTTYRHYNEGIEKCPYADDPDKNKDHKPVGRLKMLIPELMEEGVVGVVMLTTHSKNDIANIWRALNLVYKMKGTLVGVGFIAYRRDTQVSVPAWDGSGGRAKVNKSLVYVAPLADHLQRLMEEQPVEVEEHPGTYTPTFREPKSRDKLFKTEEAGIPPLPDMEGDEAPEGSIPKQAPGTVVKREQAMDVDEETGEIEEGGPPAPAYHRYSSGSYRGQTMLEAYQSDPASLYFQVVHRVPGLEEKAIELMEWIFSERRPWAPDVLVDQLRAAYRAQPSMYKTAVTPPKTGQLLAGIMEQELSTEERKDVLEEIFGFRTTKAQGFKWAMAGACMLLFREQGENELRPVAAQELQSYVEWLKSREGDPQQEELI